MTSLALKVTELPPAPGCSSAPRLRLLPKGGGARGVEEREQGTAAPAGRIGDPQTAPTASDSPVLIAGRDAVRRAEVRREMSELLPTGTCFEELGTFWEVLVKAPSSRMVILSGEIDELPAESLLHTLGHRHPDLPVVSLEPDASA